MVVCASGNGSNFQAICDGLRGSPHRVTGLVCDVAAAYALTRAEIARVPSVLVPYREGRPGAEARMQRAIDEWRPDLLALAGFMRILSAEFVDKYAGRIVNIHPSLLPKYPGLHAIERSFESADRVVGITIHLVDHEVDSGKIIEQRSFERHEGETVLELERRIHALEHDTYPRVVASLLSDLRETSDKAAS